MPKAEALSLSDIPTLPIILNYKNSLNEPIAGELHVRVSFWSTPVVGEKDVENGRLRMDSSEYLDFTEEQNITTDVGGNGTFYLGRFSPWKIPKDLKTVYAQVEYKRQSEEQDKYMLIDASTATGIQRVPVNTQSLQSVFRDQYEELQGTLLDKDGKVMTDLFVLRTSLWLSSSFDKLGDSLEDGTIRHISSRYVGAEVVQLVSPDAKGKFSLQIGKIASVGSLYSSKDQYLQMEMKKLKDYTSTIELLRPKSGGDRYPVVGGKIQSELKNSAHAVTSDTLLISQMPSGVGSTSFEIGAGNSDPNAMIDLVANQGEDNNAILRFNGMKKKWEVSSDGLIFREIATWDGFLTGTANPTFTIGLGDKGSNKWELKFGEGENQGVLGYDASKDTFSFNGDVDFGGGELKNAVLENRATPPQNPVKGQQYFNTVDNAPYYFDGKMWQRMGGPGASVYYNVIGGNNGGSTTTVVTNDNANGTASPTYTLNKNNTAGDIQLNFGTNPSQYLKWNSTASLFELGDKLKIKGELTTDGNITMGGTVLTLDGDNTGAPNDLLIKAEQGTNPDGALKYNALTGQWEMSNNGGLFGAIADISSPQTLTNKTIDGSLNTLTNIPFSSLNPRTKTMAFSPEYPGVVVSKDGTQNKGVLSSEKDVALGKNYYIWTTSQPTENTIDLSLQIKLPDDFVSFQGTPVLFEYKTETTDGTENKLDVFMADTSNTPLLLTGASSLSSIMANTWSQSAVTFAGVPTFAAGDYLYVTVKLTAKNGRKASAGNFILQYNGR